MRIDPNDPRSPSEQERAARSFPFKHKNGDIDRARELRQEDTVPERVLWSRLRSGRLSGFKFRRQHAIGPYFADFYCHVAALVVEIDGGIHLQTEQREHDIRRDAFLRGKGLYVARFSASRVAREESAVLGRILQLCRERSQVGEE